LEDQDRSWTSLGKTMLITAMSHGWIMLAGTLAIVVMTYVAAYFLISEMAKNEKDGQLEIRTPFLSIIKKPSDQPSKRRNAKRPARFAHQGRARQAGRSGASKQSNRRIRRSKRKRGSLARRDLTNEHRLSRETPRRVV
jgi:hypothetical protein